MTAVVLLRELIDLARPKPDSITYGSAGIGGINHLAMELFASAAKIQLVHVPYKGMAPTLTDLLGGNLHMLLASPASAAQYINSGKVCGLAVTSPQRSPLAPDLPTAAEAGVPGFKLGSWWGVLDPARLPPALVKRVNEELNAALSQSDVRELLAREGGTPKPGTPEDLRKLIPVELACWSKLIKDANIQTE